ncbi:MAG: hypothetical protein JWO69_2037 [Thermoleophilia bacterium]|nr:hypothetical protein [Thermoleophilia bacterium]
MSAEPWRPFPWEASDLPDDALLCDECLQGGPNLTVWTVRGEVVRTLHGRCMTTSVRLVEDELAARRAQ